MWNCWTRSPSVRSNGGGRGTGPAASKEGSVIEARKETPQARFDRLNSRVYRLKVMMRTESDIIQRLDSEPNKAGYIKSLIRADIAKNKRTAP